MKVIFCGKTFLGVDCVGYAHDAITLMGAKAELFVLPVSGDTGRDSWEPSLRLFAQRRSLPLLESLEDLNLGASDIVISLEYDRLLRKAQLGEARAYNIHFSALPEYRGALTSFWPIHNGERYAGVTLHEIAPGVDDGPIVDQIHFDIPVSCSAYDLYLLYNRNGYELFKDNFHKLLTGQDLYPAAQSTRRVSEYRRASVDYGRLREISDFNQPAVDVQNLVRALIFPPYQLPLFRGRKIVAVEALPVRPILPQGQAGITPGTILVHNSWSAIVSCLDRPVRFVFQPSDSDAPESL